VVTHAWEGALPTGGTGSSSLFAPQSTAQPTIKVITNSTGTTLLLSSPLHYLQLSLHDLQGRTVFIQSDASAAHFFVPQGMVSPGYYLARIEGVGFSGISRTFSTPLLIP
jgi:hypothetical protein